MFDFVVVDSVGNYFVCEEVAAEFDVGEDY